VRRRETVSNQAPAAERSRIVLRTLGGWRNIATVPASDHAVTGMTIIRAALGAIVALAVLVTPSRGPAQTAATVHRVGVIHVSGHHRVVVDGLRQGLRDLGLEEGKQYVLDIRTINEDLNAAEEAARALEQAKVEAIYTVTSQLTLAAKRATTKTPIVFYVGVDPVTIGLVESLPKPGGRLTGVHGLSRDVTPKRMAVLKEMLPKLRRVVTFYTPGDTVSQDNARIGRDAGRRLGIQVVERPVRSVEDIRRNLQEFKPREADAYFATPGALATSQAPLIIEAARARKLPTIP